MLYTTFYNNYFITIIFPFFVCFAFYQVCEFLTQRGVNSEIVETFRVEKVRLLFMQVTNYTPSSNKIASVDDRLVLAFPRA